MRNGECWLDIDNQFIQAHGGNILFHNGVYYWYGENKSGAYGKSKIGTERVEFIGFSCYSSKDLKQWKHEGLVLESVSQEGHELHGDNVGERPKVVYNKKTKKFVMWFHLDDETYNYARAGLAIADSPIGPFIYQGSFLPNGGDVRDMTLFVDEDEVCYLIHSSDWNRTLYISQLDAAYTNFTGAFKKVFIDQYREAPAIFKGEQYYYLVSSGCTGWDPNPALYAISSAIFGNWKLIDNPCKGENGDKTYNGQSSSFLITANGQVYLLLDHWKKENLQESGYSLLPVRINEGGDLLILWEEYFEGENTHEIS